MYIKQFASRFVVVLVRQRLQLLAAKITKNYDYLFFI